MKGWMPKSIIREQAKDTGMAMVLICLLVAYFKPDSLFLGVAILLLVVDMTAPVVFTPLAYIWLGLSHLLGSFMSKILLTIIFFLLVTPIGLLRKISGKDSLQLKKWKTGSASIFKVRNKLFQSEDIEKPY